MTETITTVSATWMRKRDRFFKGQPPEGNCEKCGERPATAWWSGEADFMAVNRGAPVDGWCDLCTNEGQLEGAKAHLAAAKEQVERLTKWIPELEAKQAALLAKEDVEAELATGECVTCHGDQYLQPCEACGRGKA